MANYDTDSFGFGRQEMFQQLHEQLAGTQILQTQNIIESKDDMIFAWNSSKCSVLCLNWRAAKTKNDNSIKHQTLVPSCLQNFIVEKLTISHEGSLLALSGCRGVAILELPRRWGRNGQYREGNSTIICSAHNLDEQFFVNNVHLKVLQVRWHPASPNDSHLMVLLSNNTIRVYDESTLRHVWRIGPIPSTSIGVSGNSGLGLGLDDMAIDFDIAPPRVVANNGQNDTGKDGSQLLQSTINGSFSSTKRDTDDVTGGGRDRVEWPLIVLRGNGNIVVALIGIDTEKPRIQGPLTMYPPNRDNYGLDSCSILVIPSLPPTIVIVESTGKMHHSLLMEVEEEQVAEESFNETGLNRIKSTNEWEIHVLETVELELGLADGGDLNDNFDSSHICLKRDPINESRYFAYHNTGLHSISLHFVRQLQAFVEAEDSHIENVSLLNTPSHVEYLVCTKALNTNKVNPVFGLTLLQSPSGLVLLLGSGQVVSLNLITDSGLLRKYQPPPTAKSAQSNTTIPTKALFQDSFDQYIRSILTANISHPILKLDKSIEPTPKQCLELLTQSTHILHENYINRLDRAREEIEKRLKLQQIVKQRQMQEIAQLQREKEQIRQRAERLAEQYEDSYEKQQLLLRRTQELVRLANANIQHRSIGEQEFKQKIERVNLAFRNLSNRYGLVKKKMENQEKILNQTDVENKMKKIILQPKIQSTIMDIISEVTKEIDGQVKDLKRIKATFNLQ